MKHIMNIGESIKLQSIWVVVPHQMLYQSFGDQQEGLQIRLPQTHMAKPMQVALPS